MNIKDAFAELIVTPTPDTKIAIDVHHLALDSGRDLFYSGSGATSRSGVFGFAGRDGHGATDIGQLVDISFNHQINKYFFWNVYYGHAFGGSVLRNIYAKQTDGDYGFLEINAGF